MEEKIKGLEKKIRTLFIFRILMWLTCAFGCGYWIYWSFKLYEILPEDYDAHMYATSFRPYFNTGIIISLISLAVSFILRFISDKYKKEMKEELFKVR